MEESNAQNFFVYCLLLSVICFVQLHGRGICCALDLPFPELAQLMSIESLMLFMLAVSVFTIVLHNEGSEDE